jgi:hypothetical protein
MLRLIYDPSRPNVRGEETILMYVNMLCRGVIATISDVQYSFCRIAVRQWHRFKITQLLSICLSRAWLWQLGNYQLRCDVVTEAFHLRQHFIRDSQRRGVGARMLPVSGRLVGSKIQ